MVDALKPRYGLDDIDVSKIPKDLGSLPYFNIWRLQQVKGRDKPTKTPLSIHTGRPHNVQDTAHLGTLQQALEAAPRFDAHGIGFSFIKGCGLIGLDFDDCITDGQIHPSVVELVNGLGYAEVSPSGSGIKVWVRADVEFTGRNRVSNFPAPGIETECYSWGRYFTVTSKRIDAISQEVRS